ncbi:MAG: adenylosuccinate lyase family protein [Gammaproteobacteria bacterium]|nr:adenylosuccinate lyase family protein [Gammaproteobacteria bacterium]
MVTHISDFTIYGSSWTTPETTELFSETGLVRGWMEVMTVLAEVQAEHELIPVEAARGIRTTFENLVVDEEFLTEAGEDFRKTNHSLIGLIKAMQKRCGDPGEWLCYGATVHDITDTQMCRTLVYVLDLFVKRITRIEKDLVKLALDHKDTPMCGRTHGQIGLPVTFGYKAATWLDEFDRHRQRLREMRARLAIGQLAGGVGSQSSLGPGAQAIQQAFCRKLGLSPPPISWTTTRDRYAEWLNNLALIGASGDRIGQEIYNLQRPEIGEVAEGFVSGTVGSITMPQKRNPEISEHLGTLSRLVRHHAAWMMENLVHDHERDGRSWKGEWLIIPESSLVTDKVLVLLQSLLPNLVVNKEKMLENLAGTNGMIYSEAVMLKLSARTGKQTAHRHVYNCAMQAHETGRHLKTILVEDADIAQWLSPAELDECFELNNSTGHCSAMVERMVAGIDL